MEYIEVRVSGAAGAGKTTAINAIKDPLTKAGFNVVDLCRHCELIAGRCVKDNRNFDIDKFNEHVDEMIETETNRLTGAGYKGYVAFLTSVLW